VALAHDALLTQWDRLRVWLAEVRQDRLFAERIERAAAHWAEYPRDDDLLWRGRSLLAADDLSRRGGVALSAKAARFLSASLRSRRRRLVATSALAGGLGVALVFAGAKYVADIRAETERAELARQEALRQGERAKQSEQEALRQKDRAEQSEREVARLQRKESEDAFRYYSALRTLAQVLAREESSEALRKLQAEVRALPEVPPAGVPAPQEKSLLEVIEEVIPEGPVEPLPIEDEQEPGLFDRGAAYAALQTGAIRARECGGGDRPNGPLKVSVVFGNDGRVAAVVTPGPVQGTDVGRCIERAFLSVHVPAFEGSPITAPKTVRIR
jgi:hypothetical protein